MLLIVFLCTIGDPALDRAEVHTRQGMSQALDATLARGSKRVLDLLHSLLLIEYRSGAPEKFGGMFSSALDITSI